MRLYETHNAFQLPVLFLFLVFLPALSRISGNSERTIIFTDHQTSFTIHGFRDYVTVLKIHGCYQDTQKSREPFHSYPSDTRQ